MLDEAWPHLSKALAIWGRQQLEPLLAENKPAWLASLQLSRCRHRRAANPETIASQCGLAEEIAA